MRIIEEFKRDKECGGTFWNTFDRKLKHTLISHRYELLSIKRYYKAGHVLNVGAGRDCGKLGDNVVSLDFRMGEDHYTKGHRWGAVYPDIVCDMHSIPRADNEFDTVMAMHVFEHTDKPKKLLREFFRVVRPGGYIALILPCGAGNPYWNYVRDKTHEYMWTRYDFKGWLVRQGFVEPKNIKGENLSNTGVIVQYGKMKTWMNKWSFDCVIRKN